MKKFLIFTIFLMIFILNISTLFIDDPWTKGYSPGFLIGMIGMYIITIAAKEGK